MKEFISDFYCGLNINFLNFITHRASFNRFNMLEWINSPIIPFLVKLSTNREQTQFKKCAGKTIFSNCRLHVRKPNIKKLYHKAQHGLLAFFKTYLRIIFNEKMKAGIRTLGWDVNESSVYISNEKGNSVSDSCPEMSFYYNF